VRGDQTGRLSNDAEGREQDQRGQPHRGRVTSLASARGIDVNRRDIAQLSYRTVCSKSTL